MQIRTLKEHLATWGRAVELQRDRVLSHDERPFEDRIADARMFAVVVRAVGAIAKLTGDASIKVALTTFDVGSPHAKEVRDILEHFDAYSVGEGHLQVGKGNLQKDLLRFVAGSPVESYTARSNNYRLWLSDEHVLDIYPAAQGALFLIAAVHKSGV